MELELCLLRCKLAASHVCFAAPCLYSLYLANFLGEAAAILEDIRQDCHFKKACPMETGQSVSMTVNALQILLTGK